MNVFQIIGFSIYLLVGLGFAGIFWFSGPKHGRWRPQELGTVVGLIVAWMPIIIWSIIMNDYD